MMDAASVSRIAVSSLVVGLAVAAAGCTRGALQSDDVDHSVAADTSPDLMEGMPPPTRTTLAPLTRDDEARESSAVSENLRRGDAELADGRPQQAARFFERVLRGDPRHAGAHHRMAILAEQSGDFASAEGHYLHALAARPGDPDLLSDLGHSYFLQRRWSESERALRDAVARSPHHPQATANLERLSEAIEGRAQAVAALRLVGGEGTVAAEPDPAHRPSGSTENVVDLSARENGPAVRMAVLESAENIGRAASNRNHKTDARITSITRIGIPSPVLAPGGMPVDMRSITGRPEPSATP